MAMTSRQIRDTYTLWKRWTKREELEHCVLESRDQLQQDDRSATDFIYALGLLSNWWCGIERTRLEAIASETELMTEQDLAVLRSYHHQMQWHFARAAGTLANHVFMDHFHANEIYAYLQCMKEALPYPDAATSAVAARQLQFLTTLDELQATTREQTMELLHWNVRQYVELSKIVRKLF